MKAKLNKIFGKKPMVALVFMITLASLVGVGTAIAEGNVNRTLASTGPTQTPVLSAPPALKDLQTSYREVAKTVLPVVTEINVVDVVQQPVQQFNPFSFFFGPGGAQGNNSQTQEYKQYGLGSGVIVRQDGNKVYVLTNNHVAGDAEEISVKLYDGRQYTATLVGRDERTDLALVEFKSKEQLPVATLGNSDSLMVGDLVLAFGNPLGFESTVTSGIVSAVGRRSDGTGPTSEYTDYIQTDAAINEGNSGGALVNINGEVVGINTWIASNSGGSIGIGFAIPSNVAKDAIDQFIQKGHIDYGWLGVTTGDVTDQLRQDLGVGDSNGSIVFGVMKGSPADKAGVLPGDFITMMGDQQVKDATDLTLLVGHLQPGEEESLSLLRDGKPINLDVKVTARNSESQLAQQNADIWPGVVVIPVTNDMRKQLSIPANAGDVIVVAVADGSPSATAGIRQGDIIKSVNGTNLSSVSDFYDALNAQHFGKTDFTINRGGSIFDLRLAK